MKYQKYFDSFINNKVELNSTRSEKLKATQKKLKELFEGEESIKEMKPTTKIQGSWATHTMIKPLKDEDAVDLDLLLCLTNITEEYVKSPRKLLRKIYDIVANSAYKDNLLPFNENKRCITLEFSQDCEIDIVPLIDEKWIINRTKDEFELSEPLKLTNYINEARKGTNLNKIAQLSKYKKSRQDELVIPSIALNVLLAHFYRDDTDLLSSNDMAKSLCIVLEDLLTFLNSDVLSNLKIPNPVNTDENLARDWTNADRQKFKDHITKILPKANKACSEASLLEGVKIWREIFGNEFPDIFPEDREKAQRETRQSFNSGYNSRPAAITDECSKI